MIGVGYYFNKKAYHLNKMPLKSTTFDHFTFRITFAASQIISYLPRGA
jgi:hypothetical protein